jgi:Fe-S-cluster containining protein
VITVTAFDVLRICRATGKDSREFAVLHEPRLLGFDPDLILNTKDGYGRYLLGLRSHPCVFLEGNLCAVHEHAPLSCRHYPYKVDRTMNARFCPPVPKLFFTLKGPDTEREKLVQELELYKEIVKEWNGNPGEKKDCIPFLLDRSASRSL